MVFAMTWVMKVAKIMCLLVLISLSPRPLLEAIYHAVKVMGNLKPRVSKSHLLNRITPPLKPIHVLHAD